MSPNLTVLAAQLRLSPSLLLPQDPDDLLLYSVARRQECLLVAGSLLLFVVRACPPHDEVRWDVRFKLFSVLAGDGCNDRSYELAQPRVLRRARVPIDGVGSLRCLCRPSELGTIAPHAVQHDRHLPGEGDLRPLGSLTFGETHCPGFHWRPSCRWSQHHVCRFE